MTWFQLFQPEDGTNVPDMTLSILYGKSSLKDMNQLITYQYEADRMNRQWYSVL